MSRQWLAFSNVRFYGNLDDLYVPFSATRVAAICCILMALCSALQFDVFYCTRCHKTRRSFYYFRRQRRHLLPCYGPTALGGHWTLKPADNILAGLCFFILNNENIFRQWHICVWLTEFHCDVQTWISWNTTLFTIYETKWFEVLGQKCCVLNNSLVLRIETHRNHRDVKPSKPHCLFQRSGRFVHSKARVTHKRSNLVSVTQTYFT